MDILFTVFGFLHVVAVHLRKHLIVIFRAHIMHYYASFGLTCFDLANKDIQRTILDATHEELDRIMANPKIAFNSVQDVNADLTSVKIQRTAFYRAIVFMYKRLKPVYRAIDKICKLFIHK